MIFSPWKRPFSMKMVRVDAGDRAPGDEQSGDVRFERHRIGGRPRPLVQDDAGARQQLGVGAIAGQQVTASAGNSSWPFGPFRKIVVSVIVFSGRTARRSSFLIRFSMSGLTQYLMVDFSVGARCTNRDVRARTKHLERRLRPPSCRRRR